ncbi:hypothetical protein [Ferirhizobium litorale]|uniref:Uncharacterized protein n=1 Tax=Ferirhizobium litorale TaxID=2927786 RepID=A0AAE3U3E7_9HYPH|nr:hypothetical protein [Fererhizobium litorale]MDI7924581.1 hypothetical protein [Fererhizobium litorale]
MSKRTMFVMLVIATAAMLALLVYNGDRYGNVTNNPELPNPYGTNSPGEGVTNVPLTPDA